ncbi:uncharacterized protein [Solanum tuberosum]|uniref:uncharacterized protein n=1 Tax=Solanum tuberosum TaxID=4113 RepID=UPI00073A4597|nr:PREDICTED: uncharacterized protein LOC107058744 [Solanum tuberosum]
MGTTSYSEGSAQFSRPCRFQSGKGIGAILSQKGHPIEYFSQKLSTRMQQASTYHREMFAITQVVSKWRQCLLGTRFTILTDQQSLKNLTNQTIQTPEQQKWLTKLVGYDFHIIYRPRKQNLATDALSCNSNASLVAIYVRTFNLEQELKSLNRSHPELLAIQQALQTGVENHGDYQFKDMMDCYFLKMKATNLHPAGLLQPLPIPDQVFEDIAMDFITCLPSSKWKTTILTVVDCLTKYGHFIPLSSTFSNQLVAEEFIVGVIRLQGPPRTIVIDRNPRFLHSFWQEINRLQGLTLVMSTTYHPQTDGQLEALNKCLEQYLHCYVADNPSKWVTMLPRAVQYFVPTFAGMTPFQALYGQEPPTVTRYILGSTSSELVAAYLIHRDAVLELLKGNLIKAQTRMKNFADKHPTELVFALGDWVFVKLKPYRQLSVRLKGVTSLEDDTLLQDCPDQTEIDDFNLEDKVDFQEGSNVVKSVDTSVNLNNKEDAFTEISRNPRNSEARVKDYHAKIWIRELPSSVQYLAHTIKQHWLVEKLGGATCVNAGFLSLEQLDLRYSNLIAGGIPKDIGSLFSLKVLNLTGNNFEHLPQSLAQLCVVEHLSLSYSKGLKEFPGFMRMPNFDT